MKTNNFRGKFAKKIKTRYEGHKDLRKIRQTYRLRNVGINPHEAGLSDINVVLDKLCHWVGLSAITCEDLKLRNEHHSHHNTELLCEAAVDALVRLWDDADPAVRRACIALVRELLSAGEVRAKL